MALGVEQGAAVPKRVVRGRFAPSPSGRMHFGNVFSACLAWLSARSQGGEFIVRLEDIDPRCQDPRNAELILDDLHWLGLDWDEEPLRQSGRGELYRAAVDQLGQRARIYPCFCSRADLHAASAPHASDGTRGLVIEAQLDKGKGPACHTGAESCFHNPVLGEKGEKFRLEGLYQLLQSRKKELPEGSYTTYLFQKGLDKILKKVGEESTEVIIAGKAGDKAETIYEIADLAYHVLVLMAQMGISVEDIREELASRHIIDHKVKQEKMTK